MRLMHVLAAVLVPALVAVLILAGRQGAAAGDPAGHGGSQAGKAQKSLGSKWIEVDYTARTLIVHNGKRVVEYRLQRYGKNKRNDSTRLGYIKPGTYRLTSVSGSHGLNAGSGFRSINCSWSIGIEGAPGRSGLLVHDLSSGRRTSGAAATGQQYAEEHPYSQGCLVVSTPDMRTLLSDLGVRVGGYAGCRLVIKGDGTRSYPASSIDMTEVTRKVVSE